MKTKDWILITLFFLILFSLIDLPLEGEIGGFFVYEALKSIALSLVTVLIIRLVWNQLLAMRSKSKESTEWKKFFSGFKLSIIGLVAFYLVLVSILTWTMFFFRSQEEFFFDLATAMIISWIVMVIVYYIWAIFFYNVNMGWDEDDWDDLKKKKDLGEDLPEDEPVVNPHAKETLGLPPGTVRGTIAVSLLIAGLAMLIASFQLDQTYDSNSLFVDNFEFIKTAFLMMIAFYFGDKSLKAIGERNQGVYKPNPNQSGSGGSSLEGHDNGGTQTTPPSVATEIVPPTASSSDVQELKEALQTTGSETKDDGDTDDFNEKGSVG